MDLGVWKTKHLPYIYDQFHTSLPKCISGISDYNTVTGLTFSHLAILANFSQSCYHLVNTVTKIDDSSQNHLYKKAAKHECFNGTLSLNNISLKDPNESNNYLKQIYY